MLEAGEGRVYFFALVPDFFSLQSSFALSPESKLVTLSVEPAIAHQAVFVGWGSGGQRTMRTQSQGWEDGSERLFERKFGQVR